MRENERKVLDDGGRGRICDQDPDPTFASTRTPVERCESEKLLASHGPTLTLKRTYPRAA